MEGLKLTPRKQKGDKIKTEVEELRSQVILLEEQRNVVSNQLRKIQKELIEEKKTRDKVKNALLLCQEKEEIIEEDSESIDSFNL